MMTQEHLTRELFLANADHTLLAPGTTQAELEDFLQAASDLGVSRVCVSPNLLPADDRGLEYVTVVGFPSGAHHPEIKAAEAYRALADGASEIDMVADRARIRARDWTAVEADVAAVRSATSGHVLKVILETGALTDEEIVGACRAAEAAGADFVKTSTGFDSSGGASEHAVSLMAETVGGRLGVKASGGIRDAASARRLWGLGATRFGVSATAQILAGWDDEAESTPRTSGGY